MTRRRVVTALLVLGLLVLVALPFAVGAGRGAQPYAGSDAAATEVVADAGHEPWFAPVWSPPSPEVESGLFAAQAAAGGLVLGYVLGVLRGRRAGGER